MQTETTRASAAGTVPGREDGRGGGQGQRAMQVAARTLWRKALPGTLTPALFPREGGFALRARVERVASGMIVLSVPRRGEEARGEEAHR